MRDLLNVARACDPDARLEHIYEWYFARTMNAIRTASATVIAIAAAIYGFVDDNKTELWPIRGLGLAAVVFALAGVIQMRELAQLHREFAVALRLLSEVRPPGMLTLVNLRGTTQDEAGGDQGEAEEKRKNALWRVGVIVFLLVALVAIYWAGSSPAQELAMVAVLAAVSLFPHIAAEIYVKEPAQQVVGHDDLSRSLEDVIGDIRLDDYVLNPQIVDEAIRLRRESLGR